MKRLLSALVSATLLATFFAGTPAPTFAADPENYYIGYDSGPYDDPSAIGCGNPDYEVRDGFGGDGQFKLEDAIYAALNSGDVDDEDVIIICDGHYTLHADQPLFDGDQGGESGPVDPISITIRGSGDAEATIIDGTREICNGVYDAEGGGIDLDFDYCNYTYATYNFLKFINTNVTLANMTIESVDSNMGGAVFVKDGSLTVDNVIFAGYEAFQRGGAIAVADSDLTVTDSLFDQSTGWSYGVESFENYVDRGGAISSFTSGTTPTDLTIENSNFYNNTAHLSGGAVYAECVNLSIDDSDFIDSTTGGRGGAIGAVSDVACDGTVTIDDSDFESNIVFGSTPMNMGGALFSSGNDVTVTGTYFGGEAEADGNEAKNGGAIALLDDTTGTTTLTLNNVDFFSNHARNNGGAVWLDCSNLVINGSSSGSYNNYVSEGESSVFLDNTAEYGGAVYLRGNENRCGTELSVDIDGVVFDSNIAHVHGGALTTVYEAECPFIPAGGQADPAADPVDGPADHCTLETIEGGITVTDSVFTDNVAGADGFTSHRNRGGHGGGLHVDSANLTVENSDFRYNVAWGDYGGAIAFWGVSEFELIVTDGSEFIENLSPQDDGGAIGASAAARVLIDSSSFAGNAAEDEGGAVYHDSGLSTSSDGLDVISNSVFIDNSSGWATPDDGDWSAGTGNGEGGAVFAEDSNIDFINTNFIFNDGGPGGDGGAVKVEDASVRFINSSFIDNTVGIDGEGGAIYYEGNSYPVEGTMTISGGTFRGNSAWYAGGAVYHNDGILNVSNATFASNTSRQASGGAILVRNCIGSCTTISNVTFQSNQAGTGGAVKVADDARVDITGSRFYSNSSRYSGGALLLVNAAGTSIVRDTVFTNNAVNGLEDCWDWDGRGYADGCRDDLATGGGAISTYNDATTGVTLSVQRSTFNNNTSESSGGAINTELTLSISESSFARNVADGIGGAVWARGDTTIRGNTFTENSSGDDGGALAIYNWMRPTYQYVESNVIRRNSSFWGGGILMAYMTKESVLSRNLLEGNRAVYGGGAFLFSTQTGSQRMAIATNRFWSNTATEDGGGLLMSFQATSSSINDQVPTNVVSNQFVRNRANFGAAGALIYEQGAAKYVQRLFTLMTKTTKYQQNTAKVRGSNNLVIKYDPSFLP